MAVWSEVQLSALYGARRLDAECYRPQILRDEHALHGFQIARLGDIAHITDGQHGYHEVDPSSQILHITAKCVKDGIVDGTGADQLAQSTHEANQRSQLAVDDVLLSTAGTIGVAGLVGEDILPANIDQDVARITMRADSPIDPAFLVAFLNAELGQFQCERATTGQIQCHISLSALREFEIPIVDWQAEPSAVLRQAVAKRRSASQMLHEAEELLESALGLDKLDLAPRLFYEFSYADVSGAGRFDGEYFSPRMQNLITALSHDRLTLADVAKLATRRFQPKTGVEFQYIEIGDVTGTGTVNSSTVAGEEAPSRATWIVCPGDVITTTVRPIRRLSAIISNEQDGHVCSSGFAVLTPTTIEPELLLVYLRLPLVCELLDLYTTASMYPAISTGNLMNIPIVLPDKKLLQYIVAKVRESFDARSKAYDLLKEAKTIVERTIFASAKSVV